VQFRNTYGHEHTPNVAPLRMPIKQTRLNRPYTRRGCSGVRVLCHTVKWNLRRLCGARAWLPGRGLMLRLGELGV